MFENRKVQMNRKRAQNCCSARCFARKIQVVGQSFNIPESTLCDKLKVNINLNGKLGRGSLFGGKQYAAIAKHLVKLSILFFFC